MNVPVQQRRRFPSALSMSSLWTGALALAGTYSLAVVGAIAGGATARSYGTTSGVAMAVAFTAGVTLVTVGTVASIRRPANIAGRLVAGLGIAWLAAEMVGWASGPPGVRSTAMVVELLLPPLLVHLGLVFPSGRTGGQFDRTVVVSAYSVAIAVGVGRAAFYDPIRDPNCWRFCSSNVFVVSPDPPVADGLRVVWLWAVIMMGLLLAARLARRVRSDVRPGSGGSWYVLVPIAAAGLAEAVRATMLLADPAERPAETVFLALFVVRGLLLTLVGVGVAWAMSWMWRVRRSLETLADDLEAAPVGGLAAVLADALGDDTVEVAYWLPRLGRHVDASGRAVEPRAAAERGVAAIERSGQTLGLVVHDPALDVADLQREIGSAARLAVDNERLRAELLAQVIEIRASQTRIVEAGDAARRRIERDIHDSAQQLLLALSFQLRLARTAAHATADAASVARLDAAADLVLAALVELREVAHGVFPSILPDGGLKPALAGLRERVAVAMDLDVPDDRYPPGVEIAAYLAVLEATAAAEPSADRIRASAQRVGRRLEIEVHIDGPNLALEDLVHVTDRVGALGGVVAVTDDGLRAAIPCG